MRTRQHKHKVINKHTRCSKLHNTTQHHRSPRSASVPCVRSRVRCFTTNARRDELTTTRGSARRVRDPCSDICRYSGAYAVCRASHFVPCCSHMVAQMSGTADRMESPQERSSKLNRTRDTHTQTQTRSHLDIVFVQSVQGNTPQHII